MSVFKSSLALILSLLWYARLNFFLVFCCMYYIARSQQHTMNSKLLSLTRYECRCCFGSINNNKLANITMWPHFTLFYLTYLTYKAQVQVTVHGHDQWINVYLQYREKTKGDQRYNCIGIIFIFAANNNPVGQVKVRGDGGCRKH